MKRKTREKLRKLKYAARRRLRAIKRINHKKYALTWESLIAGVKARKEDKKQRKNLAEIRAMAAKKIAAQKAWDNSFLGKLIRFLKGLVGR